MRVQFGIKTFLFTMILATSAFYAGWLSHDRLHPPVQISRTGMPTSRGPAAGLVLLRIALAESEKWAAGDRVGLLHINPDTLVESHWGDFPVFSVNTASVDLLVEPDTQNQFRQASEEGAEWRIIALDE